MARRIEGDWEDFRKLIGGRIRKSLRKFIKSGQIFKLRPDGKGKIAYPVPYVDEPRIIHGKPQEGFGRGNGDKGDIIDSDDDSGKGNQPGTSPGEGIIVSLDMEDVVSFVGEQLALPNMLPKKNPTFEETEIKYRKIALVGPESLRHNRRTLIEAVKRQASDGSLFELHEVPGSVDPVHLIKPINRDKRYRTYKEIHIPNTNALIVFGRDGSGSMDEERCDIVSDMAWWLEAWISRFYKKTERMYVWHDVEAEEVDQEKFYNYRYGGGTKCSSAFTFTKQQLKHRYPPEKWNVYFFYFTDGDNIHGDNEVVVDILQNFYTPEIVNLVGITQVMAYGYDNTLKQKIDVAIDDGVLNKTHVKTVSIGPEKMGGFGMMGRYFSAEERGQQILKAIRTLLGSESSE